LIADVCTSQYPFASRPAKRFLRAVLFGLKEIDPGKPKMRHMREAATHPI
jgi:hypothetical protein